MRWIRPRHTRWLAACLLMMLLTVWAGGLSFSVLMVFAVIFAAGAALLSVEFPAPPVPDWSSAGQADDDTPAEDDGADSPVEDDDSLAAEVAEEPQAVGEYGIRPSGGRRRA